ncbi:polyprenyl diphosphate synthase [Euzebya tangerina]|uniref:polyprenyl diphosphate synthase n=1 Tax=Euzebya tangerina TaxID=591198 RepID=UPI000E30EBBF|nr:polyprenyl diphosphate synthase [Euzebya tangerina]
MTAAPDVPAAVPNHVGIIMDGNGRWAGQRGLARTEGHKRGEAALFDTVEGALAAGLQWLTVYAFSTENWRRPAPEVRFIMWFNRDLLVRRADELNERGVRVRFIGRRTAPIPKSLLKIMDDAEQLTAENRRLTLQIAFNYGGQAELGDAAGRLARDVASGRLAPEDVDESSLAQRLYAPDAPDVDLMVRSSGERRLSNFLLWQAAYAELVFDEVLWPDFRRDHLFAAIHEFNRRTRRFGAV